MKKTSFKTEHGFTLAELLIVVAIIAVLVAVAIPVFNSQLEKSREGTDLANIRSAYAEVMVEAITDNDTTMEITVDLKQTKEDWDTASAQATLESLTSSHVVGIPAEGGGQAVVKWLADEQCVQITFDGTGGGGGSTPTYQFVNNNFHADTITVANVITQALADFSKQDGSSASKYTDPNSDVPYVKYNYNNACTGSISLGSTKILLSNYINDNYGIDIRSIGGSYTAADYNNINFYAKPETGEILGYDYTYEVGKGKKEVTFHYLDGTTTDPIDRNIWTDMSYEEIYALITRTN